MATKAMVWCAAWVAGLPGAVGRVPAIPTFAFVLMFQDLLRFVWGAQPRIMADLPSVYGKITIGGAVATATHGTSPATRKVPYDALKDFTAIGMIGATPNVLVVNAALPVKNVKEFIEYVKKNPGKISYGSAGQGSLTHLTMELFKQQIDSFMVHIPYRGIAPAFTDLIGGQTQAMFPGLAAAMPHIRSGRVRPLAVTGLQRHPQYKDLPTLDESGFKGFDAQQWYGVVGPAGMPAAIVKQLNETLATVLQSPELREKLSVEAIEPMVMSPEKFAAFIKTDIDRWTKIAKDRNIQLES